MSLTRTRSATAEAVTGRAGERETWRGVIARAVTAGAVRCIAWLGVAVEVRFHPAALIEVPPKYFKRLGLWRNLPEEQEREFQHWCVDNGQQAQIMPPRSIRLHRDNLRQLGVDVDESGLPQWNSLEILPGQAQAPHLP